MSQTDIPNLPDLIELIKPSVVQIILKDGQGTGFFVREDGLIITNKHVVAQDTYVKIKTDDGIEYDGEVVCGDESADYAFLFTNAPVKKILQFADSKTIRLGESVFAIGHPYGYEFSVSRGIVSSLSRKELKPGLKTVEFLQMDMGINPGNSGGPLMKMTGEVIGMVTMVLMKANEIAFAVQSQYLIPALAQLQPFKKEELLAKIYCPLCGYSNAQNSKYCDKCGTAIVKKQRTAGFNDVTQAAVFSQNFKSGEGSLSCPSCGLIHSLSELYCTKCGTKLTQNKIQTAASNTKNFFCSVCKIENSPGTQYCSKCGTKL